MGTAFLAAMPVADIAGRRAARALSARSAGNVTSGNRFPCTDRPRPFKGQVSRGDKLRPAKTWNLQPNGADRHVRLPVRRAFAAAFPQGVRDLPAEERLVCPGHRRDWRCYAC